MAQAPSLSRLNGAVACIPQMKLAFRSSDLLTSCCTFFFSAASSSDKGEKGKYNGSEKHGNVGTLA